MPSMEISSTSNSSSTTTVAASAVVVSVASCSMGRRLAEAIARFDSVTNPVTTDLFPELGHEQAHLVFARASRDAMIERFSTLDPDASADEITKEYIEVTVAEALDDLRTPGAGEFFGRITEAPSPGQQADRWYIGRRHIEDDHHDPVVVDWRAPIAAPFYRCLLYTSPSPRDGLLSRMPSSA